MKKVLWTASLVALLSSQLSAFYLDRDDFDRYFNEIANRLFNDSIVNFDTGFNYPSVNIYEHNDYYLIKVEVAGIDKNNIEVSVSDNQLLTISGEKKSEKKSNDGKVLKEESFFGKFKRVIALPQDVDSSKIDVKYENGILNIKVAKDKTKSGKRIIPIK